MSFPAYPADLDRKVWDAQEKKSKLDTGLGPKLEDVKKDFAKIGTGLFDGLGAIHKQDELDKRKAKVTAELKKLPPLKKTLTDLDTFVNKKLAELKKAKADTAALKLLEKIQNAAYKLYEEIKAVDGEVEEELDKSELLCEAGEDTEEPVEGVDRFLVQGLKFCKSKPGLFVVALGGSGAHLVAGARLAPALIKEARAKSGGGKLVSGACEFDPAKSAYVFKLEEKPPGGLARKIKAAIADQTLGQQKPKVLVRGPDGADIDADTDAAELVDTPPAKAAGGPVHPVSNVVFQQSRLLWDGMRKKMSGELQAAETKLLAHCRAVNDDPNAEFSYDLADVQAKSKLLHSLVESLDERLLTKLDEALNAPKPEDRQARHQEAKVIIEEYLGIVGSNPILTAMQASKVAPSDIKQQLLGVLNGMKSKL